MNNNIEINKKLNLLKYINYISSFFYIIIISFLVFKYAELILSIGVMFYMYLAFFILIIVLFCSYLVTLLNLVISNIKNNIKRISFLTIFELMTNFIVFFLIIVFLPSTEVKIYIKILSYIIYFILIIFSIIKFKILNNINIIEEKKLKNNKINIVISIIFIILFVIITFVLPFYGKNDYYSNTNLRIIKI